MNKNRCLPIRFLIKNHFFCPLASAKPTQVGKFVPQDEGQTYTATEDWFWWLGDSLVYTAIDRAFQPEHPFGSFKVFNFLFYYGGVLVSTGL